MNYKYLDPGLEKDAAVGAALGTGARWAGRGLKKVLVGTGQRGTLVDRFGHRIRAAADPNAAQLSRAVRWGRGAKNMFFGESGRLQTIKERFLQGGIFGRGGMISPWVTAREGAVRGVRDAWRNSKGVWGTTKGVSKAISDGGFGGAGIGIAFTAGFPAVGAVESIRTGDPRHFAREIGYTVGSAALSPIGMAGMIAGGEAGRRLGGRDPLAAQARAQAPQANWAQMHSSRPEVQYLNQAPQRLTQPAQWQPPQNPHRSTAPRSSGLSSPHPTSGRWP